MFFGYVDTIIWLMLLIAESSSEALQRLFLVLRALIPTGLHNCTCGAEVRGIKQSLVNLT